MIGKRVSLQLCFSLLLAALPEPLFAQNAPYDVFPEAVPPYYRVRYEASTEPGKLIFPVNYTIWIPQNMKTLRGVIVHQHGCGEGSCKSGLTVHSTCIGRLWQRSTTAPCWPRLTNNAKTRTAKCGATLATVRTLLFKGL